MSEFWKCLAHASILCLGAFSFGFIVVFPSPACPEMGAEFGVSESQLSLFNAISAITAVTGPFVTHGLLQFMGRRLTVHTLSDMGLIFWCLHLLITKELFWLGIVFRGLLGIVLGAYSAVIPMYIIEIAPKEHHGFFGTLNSLVITFGLVALYLISEFLTWRYLVIFGASICALQALLIWFVPESPASSFESSNDSIFKKEYAKPLFVCIMLMFFQQVSGINAILTNFNSLLDSVGIPIGSGYGSAIATSATLISNIVVGFIVQKIGLKVAWIISAIGITVSLSIYSLTLIYNWPPMVALVAIFLFNLLYGIAAGPIPWFVAPTLFPTSVRPIATNIASASNWLFVFIIIMSFQRMKNALGEAYSMLIFAGLSLISAIFGYFAVGNEEKKNNYPDTELLFEQENETDGSMMTIDYTNTNKGI